MESVAGREGEQEPNRDESQPRAHDQEGTVMEQNRARAGLSKKETTKVGGNKVTKKSWEAKRLKYEKRIQEDTKGGSGRT